MLKRYLLHPTEEEFFRTKHPFATIPTLFPMIVYYVISLIFDWNSLWMMLGLLGSLLLGIGLSFFVAILLKVYEKYYIPLLLVVVGGILDAISIVAML